MNILILGGAGFIGTNLAKKCIEQGFKKITVMDFLDPRLGSTFDYLKPYADKINLITGDIRDKSLIEQHVEGKDVVFNCAAQTSHPLSLQDPFFDTEINCIGNLRVLEAVRSVNKGCLVVYVSSSTVVGKAVGDVIEEFHWERPLDIYSANKGVAEKYYRIYHKVHDLKTVIIRFANIFGPYGKGSPNFGFINHFIDLAWYGKDITIYRPGTQTRNVMYVEDAVNVLLKSIHEPRLIGDVFFAVHDQHLSVKEIAEGIVRVFQRGRVVEIDWPEIRKRIEVENVVISSAKLRSMLRWRPEFSFEEGLEMTKRIFMESKDL